jgi:hypothetical protein
VSSIGLREAFRSQPTARLLDVRFDAERMAKDLDRLAETWWHRHAGPYHDGAWESVSLWAPRGDPFEQRSVGGAFAATPAMALAPSIREVIDQFPCERNRIRLMQLKPGGKILRHSDPLHTIDPRLVRLHVPVVTNADVHFLVNDARIQMNPGEAWHVDVRFPHQVENRGTTTRVHLVMDLVRNAAIDSLIARAAPIGRGRLVGYYAVHLLPPAIRRAWGLGN